MAGYDYDDHDSDDSNSDDLDEERDMRQEEHDDYKFAHSYAVGYSGAYRVQNEYRRSIMEDRHVPFEEIERAYRDEDEYLETAGGAYADEATQRYQWDGQWTGEVGQIPGHEQQADQAAQNAHDLFVEREDLWDEREVAEIGHAYGSNRLQGVNEDFFADDDNDWEDGRWDGDDDDARWIPRRRREVEDDEDYGLPFDDDDDDDDEEE